MMVIAVDLMLIQNIALIVVVQRLMKQFPQLKVLHIQHVTLIISCLVGRGINRPSLVKWLLLQNCLLNDLVFFKIIPSHFCRASEASKLTASKNKYENFGPKFIISLKNGYFGALIFQEFFLNYVPYFLIQFPPLNSFLI